MTAICIWVSTFIVLYTFALYPLGIGFVARFWPRRVDGSRHRPTSISVVLAVRNEQENVARRLVELTHMLAASGAEGEIIVISDGSTDRTAAIVDQFVQRNVRGICWRDHRGKAAALNCGVALARSEIVAFADARQRWSTGAIEQLLVAFCDPSVGAASGELVLESDSGVLAGVGLYWRLEKWLRSRESVVHSQVGVTGAICAVRRELFRPIPTGAILDDLYWPMQVAMSGRRVVYQPSAKAFDRLPDRTADELHRKLRTLVGNFQLITLCPGVLLPWRNPIWLQFVSHKMMRLVAPWAMLVTFVLCGLNSSVYHRTAFGAQLAVVAAGVIGLATPLGSRRRVLAAAGSFLLLNGAAWLAFWYWISGRAGKMWLRSATHASLGDST